MMKNKLIGYSPVFISILTLTVFIYQTNLIQKQQHMTFYPHLKMSNKGSGSTPYKFSLTNQGVGPAIIQSIDVKHKNESFNDILGYLKTQFAVEDSISILYDDVYIGQLIPAGEEVMIAGVKFDYTYNKLGHEKLRSALNTEDLIIEIVYKSIYDEKWIISNSMKSPKSY